MYYIPQKDTLINIMVLSAIVISFKPM